MKILKNLEVPTGNILVVNGKKGNLEMLSLADYGRDVNLKCDALGLIDDIEPVKHTDTLPLSEKWVITISTQYGCSMGCEFCDVPKVGPGKNATYKDLIKQALTGVRLHPEIKSTKRLNVHFARMGEPSWNPNVLDAAKWMKEHLDPEYKVHPVVSTMMPKNNEWLRTFIHTWMRIKNRLYDGNAGLQLSINSTCEKERELMFNGNNCTFPEIAKIMRGVIPAGRKITLNFAVAGYEIKPSELLKYFDPDDYIIKLTPMHKTETAITNGIRTNGDYTQFYPYKDHEKKLKDAGYDVLVFIASEYEDLGLITCGNAILSGSLPQVPYKEIKP
jgi:23S rRNA (adenine2503-C2)-methyltransferase